MHGILSRILLMTTASLLLAACSGPKGPSDEERLADRAALSEILRPEPKRPNPYDNCLDSMPDGCRKMHINYLGATLGRVFNDSNHVQLAAARRIGIRPVKTVSDIWQPDKPIRKIESCEYYLVDELTHSMPYLVGEAACLLDDIGRAFHDSLQSRGGGAYRLKITSVLRTPASVARLRRRNVNAVEMSTHLYGTTFDISYAKFICDNDSLPRSQEDLKNLLGEVLFDLKQAERCYIKYERKQGCFHITARPPKQAIDNNSTISTL